MNFEERRAVLDRLFEADGFANLVGERETHAVRRTVRECETGANISVVFPGKYAGYSYGRFVTDFRVDIGTGDVNVAPSHANIATDIYNKVLNGEMPAAKLRDLLADIARRGEVDIVRAREDLEYDVVAPPPGLIDEVRGAHERWGKGWAYDSRVNERDLDIEELFELIIWIAIQEDTRFPIGPKLQGRKMPFSRYVEAVVAAEQRHRTLAEVIERTIEHARPPDWPEVDYSFRKHVH